MLYADIYPIGCDSARSTGSTEVRRKEARHRELLGHGAALVQTKEQIDSLVEKVDTITGIWQVVRISRFLLFVCTLSQQSLAQVRHATTAGGT